MIETTPILKMRQLNETYHEIEEVLYEDFEEVRHGRSGDTIRGGFRTQTSDQELLLLQDPKLE